MEVSGQLQALAALTPGESVPGTQWTKDWVGPRASLNALKKKISWHAGNRTPVVQAVAHRYTCSVIQVPPRKA
jgi:hypothetical protein